MSVCTSSIQDLALTFIAAFEAASLPDAKRAAIEDALLDLVLAAHPGVHAAHIVHRVRCSPGTTTVEWLEHVLRKTRDIVKEPVKEPVKP